LINLDEIKQLKLKLTKTLEECEQLKLINQKLQQQTSSPQQVNYFILIKQIKRRKKKP
jgi:regulator of replication initiation timing